MQQNNANFVRIQVPVLPCSRPHKIVEFSCCFDAGKTAAGHDKRELRAAQVFILFDISFFENVNDVIAQVERVPDILELQRVLLQAGHPRKIHHGAQRDDEMVVFDSLQCRTKAGACGDDPPIEIDRLHLAHVQIRARAKPANRIDHVLNFDVAGNHFGQHRLKHEVVCVIDQGDFDVTMTAENLFQVHGGVDTAETATENNNVL